MRSTAPPLAGRTTVVTGATRGIGRAVAFQLALGGARVVLVGRDPERLRRTEAAFRAVAPPGPIETELADLAQQSEVRGLATRLAGRFPRVDLLVNNAGAVYRRRMVTADGLERTLALNDVAPYLLTSMLRERLAAAPSARVVMVSSEAHRYGRFDFQHPEGGERFRGFAQYSASKLALLWLTYEMARRYSSSGISVLAVHPGFVASGFGRENGGWFGFGFAVAETLFGTSPARGARTPLYASVSPELDGVSGVYLRRARVVRSSPASRDEEAQRRFWSLMERWTSAKL